jgi:hypothetical protein
MFVDADIEGNAIEGNAPRDGGPPPAGTG